MHRRKRQDRRRPSHGGRYDETERGAVVSLHVAKNKPPAGPMGGLATRHGAAWWLWAVSVSSIFGGADGRTEASV
jgi:hypothetical protein